MHVTNFTNLSVFVKLILPLECFLALFTSFLPLLEFWLSLKNQAEHSNAELVLNASQNILLTPGHYYVCKLACEKLILTCAQHVELEFAESQFCENLNCIEGSHTHLKHVTMFRSHS